MQLVGSVITDESATINLSGQRKTFMLLFEAMGQTLDVALGKKQIRLLLIAALLQEMKVQIKTKRQYKQLKFRERWKLLYQHNRVNVIQGYFIDIFDHRKT